eukprot:31272-Pelagococcus_subviridis.AAC.5
MISAAAAASSVATGAAADVSSFGFSSSSSLSLSFFFWSLPWLWLLPSFLPLPQSSSFGFARRAVVDVAPRPPLVRVNSPTRSRVRQRTRAPRARARGPSRRHIPRVGTPCLAAGTPASANASIARAWGGDLECAFSFCETRFVAHELRSHFRMHDTGSS